MYDYLIVGAGLYGAVFARQVKDAGKNCLVIDVRKHIAGNCHTKKEHGITIHKYGPHIFHTDDDKIWNYVQKFSKFNHYIHSPLANYKGTLYSLPFNMWTFQQLWGLTDPEEVKHKIAQQTIDINQVVSIEDWALKHLGKDIYEKLIYGYTKKQWQKEPAKLPASIIRRLPFRFKYDANYFNDRYQGIPVNGYTPMVENMLKGIEVRLATDYFADRNFWNKVASKIVFTGSIDQFFDYHYGVLEYRTLNFDTKKLETDNYQGAAIINFTSEDLPYTRCVEHKHFDSNVNTKETIISFEYSAAWDQNKDRFYPVNDCRNQDIYRKYSDYSKNQKHIIFGGRLGEYKYYDMHQVIGAALVEVERELRKS